MNSTSENIKSVNLKKAQVGIKEEEPNIENEFADEVLKKLKIFLKKQLTKRKADFDAEAMPHMNLAYTTMLTK